MADVRFGALPRNGVVTTNAEREAVWGLVLGLRGANAKTVVNGVKQKFEELKTALASGHQDRGVLRPQRPDRKSGVRPSRKC